jgi:hypothetical protein
MKTKILSFVLIFTLVTSYAHAECSTQTRSIMDEDGNVLYSATCTKCDIYPTVARIKAIACANAALRVMMDAEEEQVPIFNITDGVVITLYNHTIYYNLHLPNNFKKFL